MSFRNDLKLKKIAPVVNGPSRVRSIWLAISPAVNVGVDPMRYAATPGHMKRRRVF
jgi:hypothetical protein